ncbi:MAG TPA: aspartate aminotransferase family protein, partial [Ilumatobacteraceae bacterium]
LATAAGRAALNELTDDFYVELGRRAARLSDELSRAFSDAGVPAAFPVVGTLVGMYFGGTTAPTNFVEAKTTDEQVFRTFFHAMLSEGVALAPGAYEAVFVGLGHTDDVLEQVGKAAGRAAAATAEQLR